MGHLANGLAGLDGTVTDEEAQQPVCRVFRNRNSPCRGPFSRFDGLRPVGSKSTIPAAHFTVSTFGTDPYKSKFPNILELLAAA